MQIDVIIRHDTYTDCAGSKPPEDKILSNNTLVLLSSVKKKIQLFQFIEFLLFYLNNFIHHLNGTSNRYNISHIRGSWKIFSDPIQIF